MRLYSQANLSWLAGFLLTVNLYLMPFLGNSPRATDLAGLILGGVIIFRLAGGHLDRRPVVVAGITALVPLVWLFFSLLDGDTPTAVQAARWLLALPVALILVPLARNEDLQVKFAWGLLMGGLVNAAVIVLQSRGLENYLEMVGLSSSGANFHHYVAYVVRIPGLHGHHNASSAVTSLLVPAGMFLYLKGYCRLSVFLGAVGALLVSLHLTSTRGPLLVAVITVLMAAAVARRLSRSLLIGMAMLVIVTPLVLVYGPPGGWARWKNTEAMHNNAYERLDSNWGTLKIGFENPQGLGVTRGKVVLADRTAFAATHNAFLQMVLVFGIPLGLLVTISVVVLALKGRSGTGDPLFLPALLAFHTAGLFMFEEHLNNPTFIVMTAWIILVAWGRSGRTGPVKQPLVNS